MSTPHVSDGGSASRELLRICAWGWLAVAALALAVGLCIHLVAGDAGDASPISFVAAIPAAGASAMYFMIPPLLHPLLRALLEFTHLPRRGRVPPHRPPA